MIVLDSAFNCLDFNKIGINKTISYAIYHPFPHLK